MFCANIKCLKWKLWFDDVMLSLFYNFLPEFDLVLIFRSSDDDYCPKDQVEEIQNQVLAMLGDLYGQVTRG